MDAETKAPIDSDGDSRAVLYDAVGDIWLNFYGEDVHLGACHYCCGKPTMKTVDQAGYGACSSAAGLSCSAPGPISAYPPAAVPEESVQGALGICLLLLCVLPPFWLHRALFRPLL